jgi:hypothetical protein
MVILATTDQFPDMYESRFLKGLEEDFRMLKAPGRRLVMLGDVPLLAQDGPTCLAAHESDVQACSTPEPLAEKYLAPTGNFQKESAAVAKVGASFVNVTPWLCTRKTCPAVIGHYEVYEDLYHITSTYVAYLSPVLQVALGLSKQ